MVVVIGALLHDGVCEALFDVGELIQLPLPTANDIGLGRTFVEDRICLSDDGVSLFGELSELFYVPSACISADLHAGCRFDEGVVIFSIICWDARKCGCCGNGHLSLLVFNDTLGNDRF